MTWSAEDRAVRPAARAGAQGCARHGADSTAVAQKVVRWLEGVTLELEDDTTRLTVQQLRSATQRALQKARNAAAERRAEQEAQPQPGEVAEP